VDAADEQRLREFVAARSPALMRLGFLLAGGDQHAAEDLVQSAPAKPAAKWRRVAGWSRPTSPRRRTGTSTTRASYAWCCGPR
jgi:DNA-directed RNA polymerase specialized sigma24 family protein